MSMSVKICHLTSVHSRYDTRIFLKECASLANNGFSVSLIVADGKKHEQKNNVAIYDIGASKDRLDRMRNVTSRVFKKAVELDAEIYHLHDPELIPIGLKLKKLGKKVIFDAHEDLPNQILSKHYISPLIRKPLSTIVRILESQTCSRLDAVVAATPFIRDKFIKINKNTVDINNYPKLQEFNNLPKDNKQEGQVCYIGGIADVRGIVEIVQAMELTNNKSSLKVAGSFIDKSLEPKVKAMTGWEKTDYLGFVGREEIKETLSESIVGLVTLHPTLSYIDSLPVKMFEYMSAGIPVIASDFPLWRSIIDAAQCGICVDPLEPQEIADAIDYLVDNPDIATNMGENGRIAVMEKYNWAIEEKKLFKLYDDLLGSEV